MTTDNSDCSPLPRKNENANATATSSNGGRPPRLRLRPKPFVISSQVQMQTQTPEVLKRKKKSITPDQSLRAINPGMIFRHIVRLYADRKIFLFASFHVIISAVVFVHFALTKFDSQRNKVPPEAPFYSWKIGVPTFEFGTMHVILLQLAILPLTMCRLIIASLSSSWSSNTTTSALSSMISSILPLDAMTKYHIFIGYTLVILLFMSTIIFLMFFGVLCANGDQGFCDKFTSEIMITGYVMFVMFMAVGITSFFRFRIPYKVFYMFHHVVFIAYILTIMHTIDNVQRSQGGRSQAFKWFSSSILLYACDRAAMYMTQRYTTAIQASKSHAIDSGNNERSVLLNASRPSLFQFCPGQYVYLKIPSIDKYRWHPFSIASAPESDHLQFYIKVYDDASWSGKLFAMIQRLEREHGYGYGFASKNNELDDIKMNSRRDMWHDHHHHHHHVARGEGHIEMEVMGPYGTPLGNKINYSHALLIGTGTGFVPCMSVLREHIDQCLSLDPDLYHRKMQNHKDLMAELNHNNRSTRVLNHMNTSTIHNTTYNSHSNSPDSSKHSTALTAITFGDDGSGNGNGNGTENGVHPHMMYSSSSEDSEESMARSAKAQRLQIYGHALSLLGPMLGLLMFGLTISWTYRPFHLFDYMDTILYAGTIIFQSAFIILVWFNSENASIWPFVDIVFILISIGADVYWFINNLWGNFHKTSDLIYYTLLTAYMVGRFTYKAIAAQRNPIKDGNLRKNGLVIYDKVHFVWTCRSAASMAQVYPDLLVLWDDLVNAWGITRARDACTIHLHCTDKNINACQQLADEIQFTSLYQEGGVVFHRPNIHGLLANHTANILEKDGQSCADSSSIVNVNASSTMFAFCGSERTGNIAKEAKIFNDLFLSMNGHTDHVVDLVIQTYGGLIGKKKSDDIDDDDNDDVGGDGEIDVDLHVGTDVDTDADADAHIDAATFCATSTFPRREIVPNTKNAIDTDLIINRSHSFSLQMNVSSKDDGNI